MAHIPQFGIVITKLKNTVTLSDESTCDGDLYLADSIGVDLIDLPIDEITELCSFMVLFGSEWGRFLEYTQTKYGTKLPLNTCFEQVGFKLDTKTNSLNIKLIVIYDNGQTQELIYPIDTKDIINKLRFDIQAFAKIQFH
jgi:hypothetical protein